MTLALLCGDLEGGGRVSGVEKVGGTSLLMTMGIFFGLSLLESTQWAIASKIHPAIPEPPGVLWREWYISRS